MIIAVYHRKNIHKNQKKMGKWKNGEMEKIKLQKKMRILKICKKTKIRRIEN